MRCNTGILLACAIAALASAGGGCARTRIDRPLTTQLKVTDPDTDVEFWHSLSERPLTSNDEALHGVLLLIDGGDPHPDYAARVAAMRARRLLPAGFDRPADEALTRGTLAVALVQALKIRGGIMMRLAGPHPRYATRELQYLAIYPPSSPNQTFSGAEFVGIIGRVEDYQRVNPDEVPAAEQTGATQ